MPLSVLHRLLGRIARTRPLPGGAILTFHSVGDPGPTGVLTWARALTVSPTFLESVILELRRRHIAIVSLAEATSRLEAGDRDPFVAITFDDGYADNFQYAFPILRRYDAPFAIFLPTGFLDRKIPMWWSFLAHLVCSDDYLVLPHATLPARSPAEKNSAFAAGLNFLRSSSRAELPDLIERTVACYPDTTALAQAWTKPLEWEMVRSMARSGLATFGSHTVTHPVLGDLTADEILEELDASAVRLSAEIGCRPEFFAYPYGSSTDIGGEAPRLVASFGFRAAFTTKRGLLRPSQASTPHELPRISMSGHHQHAHALAAYFFMAENNL